jgi:5-methylcytosine-specific restriction endonuclease McrA
MRFPHFEFDYQAAAKRLGSPHFCAHSSSELRCKPDKNNRPRYHKQCLACGSNSGSRVSAAQVPDPATVPLWDEVLPKQVWAEFQQRMNAHRDQETQAARKRWNDHYYGKYLPSKEWKEKRRLVMLRSQGICEGCRRQPASEVHHLTYQNVGDEFLFQLAALCHQCHDRLHAQIFPQFLQNLFYAGLGRVDHAPPSDDEFPF